MEALAVHRLQCPWCWERIELVLDLSAGSHSLIEDCHVCCHPIRVDCTIEAGQLCDCQAQRAH